MEDEVQLQSLAKRLINIYNACKWSKTKLHLRKKKRNQHFEEYTEVETESSARTIFAYNRNYRNKTEKHIQILQSAVVEQYGDEGNRENIRQPYCNDQSINVCTCKKCCCDPGKYDRKHESMDARKNFEDKKKSNSKIIICLKPTDGTKNVVRGCCCPDCSSQNSGPQPMKNKSNIKTPKTPPTSNRDNTSQYVPPMTEVRSLPSPSTSERFSNHYPPASTPPSKPSKATKETLCPGSGSNKKCCECPPTPSNASFSCQCTPPKSVDSLCCKCQPSAISSPGCCKCPPSPLKTSDCCQCGPPASSSFGCQYLHPSPASLCCCDFRDDDIRCCCPSENTNHTTTIVCTDKIIIPTCYFNEGEPRSPSGNSSLAVSEEVKNVFLDGNSLERKYDTSDKQINTSCVIVKSCTPSMKREQHEDLTKPVQVAIPSKSSPIPRKASSIPRKTSPIPRKASPVHRQASPIHRQASPIHRQASPIHRQASPIPRKASPIPRKESPIPQKASSIPRSIKDCNYRNCQCREKEVKQLNDQMINTSCVMVGSCTSSTKKSEPRGHLATNPLPRQCGGACCKCQHNGQNDNSSNSPMHPEQHNHPLAHSPSPPMHPEQHAHPHNPVDHSPSHHMHAEQHPHPHNPVGHSPSHHMHAEQHGHPHSPLEDSPSYPMHVEQHVHTHDPLVNYITPPMHHEQHVQPHIPLVQSPMHPKQHGHPHNPLAHSASPPIDLGQYGHHYSSQIHSPSPPVHPRHNAYPPHPLVHSASPPIDLGHHGHPQDHSPRDPMHSRHHHDPAIHPAITGTQILRYPSEHKFESSLEAARVPQDGSLNHSSGEERMIAKHSPQPFSDQVYPSFGGQMVQPSPNQNQMSPVQTNNNVSQPLYGGMVPPRQTDFTGTLLRSQSTPLCCKQANIPTGGGDDRIAGINDDTEAEIYATLQKIEFTLRDEADSHSRNMRCIVDQVCKQAGEIKELKVLVTGVVHEKRALTCKQVEKKIKKLEKRKELSAAEKREFDLRERERRRRSGKHVEGGNLEEVPSNLCCKCHVKKIRPMGCCGKCCAKRCRGCCGTCCKGCFPKFCNCCCAPCEKCCPSCCCGFAKCCDTCWSCRCCPHRKKKCQCSK